MKMKYYFLSLLIGLCTFACQDKENPEPDPVIPDPPVPVEPVEPVEPEWFLETDSMVPAKGVALLDMAARNQDNENGSENGRNVYSADYMLELAGVPFFTTTDLAEAMSQSSMILFSSPLKSQTFTTEELDTLTGWVKGGGAIVAPAVIDVSPQLTRLFGVSSSAYNKLRYNIIWSDEHLNRKELEYMDEVEEKDISIGQGRGGSGESIKSYAYTLSGAEELASFNTGGAAVVCNKVGNGCAYSFGVLWRDVIQRSQLNKDFSASRWYSNDFEPSADAFPLFIRSAYAKRHPVAVWKFTIPGGYESVLIPTHDCDSQTAYNEMHYMSEYEKSLGLKAHYFLTVHFYRDQPYLSAFYNEESIEKAKLLLRDGHTVGSHSIGHFPDFSVTARFPLIEVSRDEYCAHHDLATGITTGGSTWAEVVLSKQIIEKDLGNSVRSFRTGHLAMNKNIPKALKMGGYSFSSCYGAGDVLGEFPFLERLGNEWIGEQSMVLQMPLHFSDVINDDPINEYNWDEKSERWLKVLNKLKGNYAPSILLIHPNRDWKMLAEKMLVDKMDRSAVGLWNFEEYGDFWLKRRELKFEYGYLPEKNKIIIKSDRKTISECRNHAFAIEVTPDVHLEEVIMMDENHMGYKMAFKQIAHDRFLVVVM